MGYTHYWKKNRRIPRPTWAKIRDDAERLLDAYGRQKLEGVEVSAEEIAFGTDCEGFWLQRRRSSDSCKTNGWTDDRIVCAILCVAKQHSPTFRVGSDAWMGDPRDKWPEAAAWATRVLRRPVPLPVKYRRMPIKNRVRSVAIRFGLMD